MTLVEGGYDVNSVAFTYPFLEGIDPLSPPPTLVIPQKYLDAMANMERQYWDIKSKHYNIILFFKKGKFYELYDYDAVIASREFGLKMVFDTSNRGKMRLAGVPEQSYNEWARLFVFRGYKVGRVEQMKEAETEIQSVKAKVVPRELVEVLTPGTLKDSAMLSGHGEIFVLTLAPSHRNGDCFIDAFAVDLSRRVAHRCRCQCDGTSHAKTDTTSSDLCIKKEEIRHSVNSGSLRALSALLQQLNPKEVIMPDYEWGSGSQEKKESFKKACDVIAKWVAVEDFVVEAIPRVFTHQEGCDDVSAQQVMTEYFFSLCLASDVVLFEEATDYTAHLAGVVGSMSVGARSESAINDVATKSMPLVQFERRFDRGLTLDATTVSNLEVLTNLHDGSVMHSLNHCLNRCTTNGGRRLFRSWLLRPSSNTRVIAARQDAVQFLVRGSLMNALTEVEEEQVGEKRSRSEGAAALSSVVSVDFERILSRLCDMKRSDSQNIAYVDPMVQYKKNLGIILSAAQALSAMVSWGKQLAARCLEVASEQGDQVPALLDELLGDIAVSEVSTRSIEGLFDRQAAEESGMLIPAPGTSAIYDAATAKLRCIEASLHDVRRQLQLDVFGGSQVHFADLGKDLFLLEVAAMDAPKMTPKGMVERARSSKSVKYVVASLESLVAVHREATAAKSSALLTVLCSVAGRMCDEFPRLFSASGALSYLDCLLNLAQLHRTFAKVCYPRLRSSGAGEAAAMYGKEMVHPLLTTMNPVANSVNLGDVDGRVLLLTGPNMAGKSTLMRTVAINVILAQLGGPVLATAMELSPVDRIFTRIGARDASHKGQSTLFVELSETADILHSATARSLCLIDELGRGTSTHDGMAIAHATLGALTAAKPAVPLTIFSTHYHALAMERAHSEAAAKSAEHVPTVQLGYMDFVLPTDSGVREAKCDGGIDKPNLNGTPTSNVSSVVFLYRLVRGICARSYGVEVALMAGIPASLVHIAKSKSEALSRETAFHEDVRDVKRFLFTPI